MLDMLKTMSVEGLIRPIDYQFARFIGQLHHTDPVNPVMLLCSALVSHQLGQGHVCLSFAALQSHQLIEGAEEISAQLVSKSGLPVDQWPQHLTQSPVVGDGRTPTPLVLDNNRLYLYRYWLYEIKVAAFIRCQKQAEVDSEAASLILDRLFKRQYTFIYTQCAPLKEPSAQKEALIKWLDIKHADRLDWPSIYRCLSGAKKPEDLTDLDKLIPGKYCLNWQKIAAAQAAMEHFTLISGGPGTGKTTTVTKLLAMLVELSLHKPALPVIRLVAPTGKAAARLTQSIGAAIDSLDCDQAVTSAIPTEAGTIHRLLEVLPGNRGFRHHQHNRLHLDILVVDEASMIDLPLMSRLLEALPDHARLILLGDQDQLASVEAGSVLGDICEAAEGGYSVATATRLTRLTGFPLEKKPYTADTPGPINDNLCLLEKSYRFDQRSGIGSLANAINTKNIKALKRTFSSGFNDITLYSTDEADYQTLIALCTECYRAYLGEIHSGRSYGEILQAFGQFQLLCALREGKYGVSGLNMAIEQSLIREQLIAQDRLWYEGRPVLVTQNSHDLGLYNGDIGIALNDNDGRLRVIFGMPDGSIKTVLPSRLPAHETVYAMTIHKSQGSEFDHAAVVLPDKVSPVLTRELIYTGITRAKKKLDLFCRKKLLVDATQTATARLSGLKARLRGA
ncbi:exodeoxyribonuclease V subunit alpha [Candidatus Sororendozoicomonas aggregata]|uniref:exodeoxyribonuclease V subunit alpha n=1 Tax=Candidatus Sororendozoicomonas aggregata TaxID=3073239 RepID=UPI002ED599B0